ncbi:hypothetical protein ACNKHL_17140 [Shigella flexneri]
MKDPADLVKLLTRQCRHSFEDCELPLFRESENAGQLFNSDGEQDVGNRCWLHGEARARLHLSPLGPGDSQEPDALVDVTPDNLLHNIQSTFWNWKTVPLPAHPRRVSRSDNKRPLDPLDSSITFHVCHSPQREVGLSGRLPAMLEEDPTLTPRDIIVMVADIDSYSPFIQAVFVAHLRIVTCLTPFPTVGARQSRIRYWKRLSACYRCQTAALCRKTCWHYWMCRRRRRGLTSPKKGCVIHASGPYESVISSRG